MEKECYVCNTGILRLSGKKFITKIRKHIPIVFKEKYNNFLYHDL